MEPLLAYTTLTLQAQPCGGKQSACLLFELFGCAAEFVVNHAGKGLPTHFEPDVLEGAHGAF